MEGGPGNARALDCGAGIGRITKHLLTKVRSNRHVMMVFIACLTKVSPNTCSCCVDSVEHQMFLFFKIPAPQHFERVDLLEQDKHFLEKAVEYLEFSGLSITYVYHEVACSILFCISKFRP